MQLNHVSVLRGSRVVVLESILFSSFDVEQAFVDVICRKCERFVHYVPQVCIYVIYDVKICLWAFFPSRMIRTWDVNPTVFFFFTNKGLLVFFFLPCVIAIVELWAIFQSSRCAWKFECLN